MPEERLKDDVDECLRTIFCEGDCLNNSPGSCKASTEEWSHGENTKSNGDINVTTPSAEQVDCGENVTFTL